MNNGLVAQNTPSSNGVTRHVLVGLQVACAYAAAAAAAAALRRLSFVRRVPRNRLLFWCTAGINTDHAVLLMMVLSAAVARNGNDRTRRSSARQAFEDCPLIEIVQFHGENYLK